VGPEEEERHGVSDHDDPVTAVLARVRGGLRRWATVRGGAIALLGLSAATLVSFALDYLLRLDRISRGVVGLVLLLALAELVRRVLVRPLRARLGDDELALVLERRFAKLGEFLVSAVQFRKRREDPAGMSVELMDEVAARAREDAPRIPVQRVFDLRAIGRVVLIAAGVLTSLLGLAAIFPAHVGIWARRNLTLADVAWPRRTTLVVEDFANGVLRVPRGETVAVIVRVEGRIPSRVDVGARFDDGFEEEAALVDLTDGRFRHTFPTLVESVTFRLSGGDHDAGPYRIQVVERPAAEWLRLTLTYPGYLGRPPETHDASSGGLRVPAGTTIDIRARTRDTVAGASVRLGVREIPSELEGGREVRARATPTESERLILALVDAEGLSSDPAVAIDIGVDPDQPPSASIRVEGVGSAIAPRALLPLHVTAADDHGLSAAGLERLRVRAGEDEEKRLADVIDVPGLELPGPEVESRTPLDLSSLPLEPGDALRLQVVVRDNDGLVGPKEGRSEPVTFRIVSRDDLLAEMVRRQQEVRRDLERVLERVKADAAEAGKLESSLAARRVAPEALAATTELARGQRRSARRTAELADRFERIVGEMRWNRLIRDAEANVLSGAIPVPLRRLADGPFQESADGIEEAGRGGDREERLQAHASARRGYDEVVAGLRRVLEALRRAEGFTELVERLRQVVRLEGEVRAATEAEYRRRIRELFPEEEQEGEDR
jgi:hypothetical protein